MPFKSKQQMKACFASKGFGGKVDCEEWARKTKNFKDLPQKACYKESEADGFVIRTFSKDLDPEELKWHRDREDRIVIPLQETDWMFQRDNQLPEKISKIINIKANEWHRIIKGTNNLTVKIKKL